MEQKQYRGKPRDRDTLPGSVVIGYVHPNIVMEGFTRSLAETCLTNENGIVGIISASDPKQHVARNSVIEKFLAGPGEWLIWIDTDMTFERDSIARLRATAVKEKAHMVGGLAFVYNRGAGTLQPNGWGWDYSENHWVAYTDYTPDAPQQIDGTGAAFILIHREVFETLEGNWHQNWVEHPATGKSMGHDLAFCYDAVVGNGYRLIWDTSVKTGHIKHVEMTEESWEAFKQQQ